VDVSIANPRSEYLYGSYEYSVPLGYGQGKSSVVLLSPSETLHTYNVLNHSLFASGYSYSVPASASFNDAKAKKTLSITGGVAEEEANGVAAPCAAGFLLLGILSFRVLK
jgi:hypothetical protein